MSVAEHLVVIVAGAQFDGVRRSARSLAEALSVHVRVLFVDPSRSTLGSDVSVTLKPKLRRVNENLFHLGAVAVPAHTRHGIRSVVAFAVERAVRDAIGKIGVGRPAAVFLQTPQMNVLGRFNEDVSIYWATDSFQAGASLMGVDPHLLASAEASAAADADFVVAVTDHLAATWQKRGMDAVVVRNGVDSIEPLVDDAGRPADLTLASPFACVVGTLSNRLDFELLTVLADKGVSVLLIGPASFRTDRSAFDEFCLRPNVLWLAEKDHAELAAYYQHAAVGLVPYTRSEFNMVSAPLKPLEYLSAGLPVVSTELPGVIAINSPDIEIANDPKSFLAATMRGMEVARNHEMVQRRRSIVREWGWDRRAEEVLGILGLDSAIEGPTP